MQGRNQTDILQFFLGRITDDPALQPLIFCLLFIDLVTNLGNLLIILAVSVDSHLHTPMHFFLSKLSLTDVCLSTPTIRMMLENMQTQNLSITYTGCLTQVCFILEFASLETCLLPVMAYDQHVAISHPLNYKVIMNHQLCGLLLLMSLLISMVNTLLLGSMLLGLSFSTDLEIPLFFCEVAQVIKLACSDTVINNILIYISTFIFGGVSNCGIIFSYTKIVSSVTNISSERKTKGLFHLWVSLIGGIPVVSAGVYITCTFTISRKEIAMASLMYIVVPLMMNPFIYSLRNKDMIEALRKLFKKTNYIQ